MKTSLVLSLLFFVAFFYENCAMCSDCSRIMDRVADKCSKEYNYDCFKLKMSIGLDDECQPFYVNWRYIYRDFKMGLLDEDICDSYDLCSCY